jgi:hypothetical protein
MNRWVRPVYPLFLAAAALCCRIARADGGVAAKSGGAPESAVVADGVYGRFDGDLDVSIAGGSAWSREGLSGALLARVLFLETAGAYVSYADRFDSSGTGPRRSIAVGVTLRPLFVPRWGLDLEHGPAILDLTIDATALELGALWVADGSPGFSRPPGVELALGTEIPLAARIEGLWIGVRGALRWSDAELAGTNETAPLKPSILFTVAWHTLTGTHLVDAGDRRMH